MLTRLPHRITIFNESRVEYAGGCYTTSWITSTTEWANCQVLNNVSDKKESHEFNKKQQFTKWKVITRAETDITNKQRILFNSKILTVEAVSDSTARGRMIEITCREENL